MSQRSLLELPSVDEQPESVSPSIVEILPAGDVLDTLRGLQREFTTTILDPWYNKGVGGTRDDYETWLQDAVHAAARVSSHIFVWGFPEIVHCVLRNLPPGWDLTAWLTWYYKNCPSVIRGWRSAQNACLHLSRKGATLYPEHFLSPAQLDLQKRGKLRYMPGPPNVIEASLNVGFVGRHEQTGHPSQKPIKAIEPLILMTTKPADTVLDPMCGSGTTGVACQALGRHTVLSDLSDEYLDLAAGRLTYDEPCTVIDRRSTASRNHRQGVSRPRKPRLSRNNSSMRCRALWPG